MNYDEAAALRLVRNAVRCYNERLRTGHMQRLRRLNNPTDSEEETLAWVTDIPVEGWIGLGVQLRTRLMEEGDPLQRIDLSKPPVYSVLGLCVRISDHTGIREDWAVNFVGHHKQGTLLEMTDDQIRAMVREMVDQASQSQPKERGQELVA